MDSSAADGHAHSHLDGGLEAEVLVAFADALAFLWAVTTSECGDKGSRPGQDVKRKQTWRPRVGSLAQEMIITGPSRSPTHPYSTAEVSGNALGTRLVPLRSNPSGVGCIIPITRSLRGLPRES